MAATLFFVLALFGIWGAWNALRSPQVDKHPILRPKWFSVMLIQELVPLRIAVHAGLGALFIFAGALDTRLGWVALWLTLATWIVYAVLQFRSARAKRAMADALAAAGVDPDGFAHVEWRRVLAVYPYRVPKGIERIEDIEYAPGLRLDVYRRPGLDGRRPALMQVHGGGWTGGNRRQQARPLMDRMASAGWICASVSYPLAPGATFPEPLIALKRAVHWMRTEGARYDIDPDFIAVTGGSAGGHLVSLLALTANRPEYQPGFEEADTEVQAAVPAYGIYDFLNRNDTRDDWPVIPRGVMKLRRTGNEDRFREASPLDQVHPDAPPFLIIHGSHDALVPVAEAMQFVELLAELSTRPVVYAEIPGATHAFDIVHSLRTHYVISGVQRFLEAMYERRDVTEPDVRSEAG
jgi:acetyl esterase/lipase